MIIPMRKLGRLALALALAASAALAPGLAGTAWGAPMSTDLTTVRSDSATIVIGTVRWVNVPSTAGPGALPKPVLMISVDSTIRGTAPAVMSVGESPDGHAFVDNERVVAFVDGKNALRWIGRKIAGPDIEHGVLQLQGFFDFNAHIVHPGMMTLAQLKTYLATGTIKNTFVGTIAFPDGHGGFRPSARHLALDWDPVARTGSVSGFAPSCLALNTVFGLEWGQVELRFTDTCNYGSKSRSLSLDGKPTGVDASGAITVDLVPTEPLLEESEFDPYVTDGHVSDVTRVVRVTLADGTAWSWHIGKGLLDPSGKKRGDGGAGSSISEKATPTGKTTTSEQYWQFGEVTIRLSQTTTTGTSPSIGNDSGLLAAIDAGGWKCSFERKGLAPSPCTLRQDPPIVVRR